MVSSKGEPDNPKLREQCKEEVKNMEKGGGKGSWSAWKAGELARLYESRGGGYKDTGDNKNKAQKGYPERKKDNSSKKDEGKKEDNKDEGKEDKSKKDDKDEGEKDEDTKAPAEKKKSTAGNKKGGKK